MFRISVNPLKVFGKISVYATSVFLIFMVTLTCFPAITLFTQSVNSKEHPVWAKKYFIPVSCMWNKKSFLCTGHLNDSNNKLLMLYADATLSL